MFLRLPKKTNRSAGNRFYKPPQTRFPQQTSAHRKRLVDHDRLLLQDAELGIMVGNAAHQRGDEKPMRPRPQPKELLRRLKALMRGYGDLLKQQASTNPKVARLANLLDGFRESRDHYLQVEAEEARRTLPLLKDLLAGYLESRARWADKQKAFADDFNLFEVMGIENLERFHSKILAWLLDRRIEHGTHAQGNLGFRLFLEELGKDLAVESNPQINTYPDEQYWVRCEVSGEQSRIDIEIAARGKFIIHIENKIRAQEGPEPNSPRIEGLERAKERIGNSKREFARHFSNARRHGTRRQTIPSIPPCSMGSHCRMFSRTFEKAGPAE